MSDPENTSNGPSRTVLILVSAVAGIAMAFVLMMLIKPGELKQGEVVTRSTTEAGFVEVGGPFSLIDHAGRAVSHETFLGSYTLVYFGYTYCPDVCPLGLLLMHEVMDDLGGAGDVIQPLFITVDPERDTPDAVADYIASFHPRLVGLTGTPENVKAMADSYKMWYRKAAMPGAHDPDAYAIDHMNILYLMGPEGTYRAHYINPGDPDAIAADIRKHLKK